MEEKQEKDETIEILKKARELIRKGWAQETFSLYRGTDMVCYCALGAIGPAAGGHPGDGVFVSDGTAAVAVTALCAALGASTAPLSAVTSWNDDPKRTQEDVIGLYDRAIASLEVAS